MPTPRARTTPARARSREGHSTITRQTWAILAVAIVATVAATTAMNQVKLVTLRSTWSYDLAFYANGAFNLVEGQPITYIQPPAWFDASDQSGPAILRHSHLELSFVLLVLTVFRAMPSVTTLFACHSLLIAVGAIPLFLMVFQRTSHRGLSLVTAFTYLLHPALLHLAFNDIRPVTLGIAPALFALYFHARGRLWLFLAAAAAALAARQEWLFLVAIIGWLNYFNPGTRRRTPAWLLLPLAVAAAWAVVVDAYYLVAFGRHWPVLAGSQSGGVIGTASALLERLPPFFRITLLPGLLALWTPWMFVGALPFVAAASGVLWPAFPHHHLQHLSHALVVVFWAFGASTVAIWQKVRARGHERAFISLLAAAALLSFLHFGWGAYRTYVAVGMPTFPEAARISSELPKDATVWVPRALAARFVDHRRLVVADLLPIADGHTATQQVVSSAIVGLVRVCDLVALEKGSPLVSLLSRSGRFLPARDDGTFLYFLARPTARVQNPDAVLQAVFRWDRLTPVQRRWSGL